MPKTASSNRVIDARPDRIDYKDRMYQPKLVSLPERFPDLEFVRKHMPSYKGTLVLDQGNEGACVGFGLAALINYLHWKKSLETVGGAETERAFKTGKLVRVSPRMLHTMARFYDEWPGEAYSGTSPRGAMKGWFRHGVCSEDYWPFYSNKEKTEAKFVRPKHGWQQDALKTPLGAYYRVNRKSLTDMQSALCEVGALFVNVKYHDGWHGVPDNQKLPPVIKLSRQSAGGHAFALVGYEPRGFILQNSWGPTWGFNGFAIITYEDWLKNGEDCWVAVLGAPVDLDSSDPVINVRARRRLGVATVAARSKQKKRKREFEVLAPADAYQHTVVLGDNGAPSNRFLDIGTAPKAVEETVRVLPTRWLRANRSRKVVIFALSGLTTEEAAIDRVRVLAPRFTDNGIYPIFITMRAGFKHTLARLIDQSVAEYMLPATALSKLGFDPAKTGSSLGLNPEEPNALFSDASQSHETRDHSIEVACQDLMVKPIWMQMKRNAEAARKRFGALDEIVKGLQKLKNTVRNLEIHLVGHSGGAYLVGHLLKKIAPMRLRITSCSLYAPACTVDFACEYFLPVMGKGGPLQSRNFFVEVLSDKREQDDSIGPYKKSLLYLISRGMEDVQGIPILGMEKVWNEEKWPAWPDDVDAQYLEGLNDWRKYCRDRNRISAPRNVIVNNSRQFTVVPGKKKLTASHVDFDRDVRVITRTIERVRRRKLRKRM